MEISLAPTGKLKPPGPGVFDASPKAMREWVLSFNGNNTGEATRAIYKLMSLSNTLDLPAPARLNMLERVGTMLVAILPKLHEHFSSGVYPLPERSATIAQLSIELQLSMIVGYRLVLQQASSDASWLKRLGQQKLWVTSAHRMFYFYGGLMRTSQLLHRPYPRGLWYEFHQLFKEAHASNRASEKVQPIDADNSATTLEHEYQRILLISLLPPHRFNPAQLKEICASMDYWVGLTRLFNQWRERDQSRFNVLVTIDSDTPPVILPRAPAPDANENEWLLSTVALAKTLRSQAENAARSEDQSVLIDKRIKVSGLTLKRLFQHWCNPPLRREQRLPSEGVFTASFGISGIHEGLELRKAEREAAAAAADAEARAAEEVIDDEVIDTAEPSEFFSFGLDATEEMPEEDMWDPLNQTDFRTNLREEQEQQKRAPPPIPEKPSHYVPVTALMVNYSKHGYRLRLPVERRIRLKVGELIGLEQGKEGQLEVGTIRWLQESNEQRVKTVLMGVRLILHSAFSANLLIRIKGTESAPQPCLVGVHNREFATLILPALPGLGAKRLAIKIHDIETEILLEKQILATTQFEVWHVQARDRRVKLVQKGLSLELLRQLLSKPIESEGVSGKKGTNGDASDYGNLWDTL